MLYRVYYRGVIRIRQARVPNSDAHSGQMPDSECGMHHKVRISAPYVPSTGATDAVAGFPGWIR